MIKTPNWKDDIDLAMKCGSCKHYKSFVKGNVLTAHGNCLLKNKYKMRTESCLKYKSLEEKYMLNRVVLVGRLTRDPELKYTPSGVAVAIFNLAVNRSFTNQKGEHEADFINCVVWRKPAENAANFLKKGSLAGVDGRIQTRSYDGQDGKRVYVTEVVAESVQFLDTKKQDNGGQHAPTSNTRANEDPFANAGQLNIDDSDLPF